VTSGDFIWRNYRENRRRLGGNSFCGGSVH
jgi:hypothetical protein